MSECRDEWVSECGGECALRLLWLRTILAGSMTMLTGLHICEGEEAQALPRHHC